MSLRTDTPTESVRTRPQNRFLEPAPFAVLKRQVAALITLTESERVALLRVAALAAIATVEIDVAWYFSAYPDIEAAVVRGEFESARHHYSVQGFFEGRLPQDYDFDEDYYLANNPDIQHAFRIGTLSVPKAHFMTKGFAEGRVPSAAYSFCSLAFVDLISTTRKKATF
jgi:hypothetical protein